MNTIYILKCFDKAYGCTKDLTDPLSRHEKGQIGYTSKRLPIAIVHQSIFVDKYKANEFDVYLNQARVKRL